MEKEFIPYEIALALKELGFDEPCFARYYSSEPHNIQYFQPNYAKNFNEKQFLNNKEIILYHSAPTFSQAFRWFREKYNLKGFVSPVEYLDGTDDTYHWCIYNECNSGNDQLTHEEAELKCLKKLIEIVKNK
jgi:hypothetical protein